MKKSFIVTRCNKTTVPISLQRLHLPLYVLLQREIQFAALWTEHMRHKSCPPLQWRLNADSFSASWLLSLKGKQPDKVCLFDIKTK